MSGRNEAGGRGGGGGEEEERSLIKDLEREVGRGQRQFVTDVEVSGRNGPFSRVSSRQCSREWAGDSSWQFVTVRDMIFFFKGFLRVARVNDERGGRGAEEWLYRSLFLAIFGKGE